MLRRRACLTPWHSSRSDQALRRDTMSSVPAASAAESTRSPSASRSRSCSEAISPAWRTPSVSVTATVDPAGSTVVASCASAASESRISRVSSPSSSASGRAEDAATAALGESQLDRISPRARETSNACARQPHQRPLAAALLCWLCPV